MQNPGRVQGLPVLPGSNPCYGAFFVAQEVQVPRHGAARHLELLDEVASVRQIKEHYRQWGAAPLVTLLQATNGAGKGRWIQLACEGSRG